MINDVVITLLDDIMEAVNKPYVLPLIEEIDSCIHEYIYCPKHK